jgi:sarcosine oxidase
MSQRIEDADVVVVGLGAMGSATLWALARRGVRAVGVEQFEPGHDRGSSHGESRIIRTAYFEGEQYVPLVRRAWTLWRELEQATGEPLLTRTGGLTIGRADSALVTRTLAAAAVHDRAVERLDGAALRQRFPQHVVGDAAVGLLERDAGILRPEAGVRAAVTAAVAAGASVVTGSAVDAVVPDADRPRVVVGDTEIRARHVVVAAGSWASRLVPDLAGALRVVRRVMGWFVAADPAPYDAARFPLFLRDDGDGPVWYGFPTRDGRTVKIAEHQSRRPDEPADPQVGVRPPDAADARVLAEFAGRLRGLGAEPDRMRACMYTMTPDEHFVVGRRAGLPGLTLLAGFSGHGFKFAPALGEAAADLAIDGATDAPIGLFDPERFGAGVAAQA